MKLRRRRGLGRDGSSGSRSAGPDPNRLLLWAAEAVRGVPRRWWITLATMGVAFAVGYGAAATWLFPAQEERPDVEMVLVPPLTGQSVESALEAAERARLGAEVEFELHVPEEPAGRVVAQHPLPGQMASPGTRVRLAVSLGPEVRRVPELWGLSARHAARVLEQLGFRVETRAAAGGTMGGVQGTRPEAGAQVEVPATVEILVAEGPRVVVVPGLRGRHIDDVEALLEEADLRLGEVRWEPEAPEAPGRVVGQSPPAGYSTRAGGAVQVEVAGRPGDAVPGPAPPPRDPPDEGMPEG